MNNYAEFFDSLLEILKRILSHPEEHDLSLLASEISEANEVVLKLIVEKLMGALLTLLLDEKKIKPGIKVGALQCLSSVVIKCKLQAANDFLRLYSLTCQQIFDSKICSLDKSKPEELKKQVMLSLSVYSEHLSDDALKEVYSSCNDTNKVLSQGVLLAVQIAKTEKSVPLRCSALKFILALAQHQKLADKDLKERIGALFVNFLPGLITPLTEIITKDDTCHHIVIEHAVKCWSVVLNVTLSDFPEEKEIIENQPDLKSWVTMSRSTAMDDQAHWLSAIAKPGRTREWIAAAVSTLKILIKRVAAMVSYPHPDVKIEIARSFAILYRDCEKNLGAAGGPILDGLILLRGTFDATQFLPEDLESRAQGRLPEVLTQLSTAVRSGDQENDRSSLHLVSSYLTFFKPDIGEKPCIVANPPLLTKFLAVLRASTKVQLKPDLLHEHELEASDFERYDVPLKEIEVLIADEKLTSKKIVIVGICESLSDFNFEIAITITADEYKEKQELERLVWLNLILENGKTSKVSTSQVLLELYLEANDARVPCDPTAKELSQTIATIVLGLKGIGQLAKSMAAGGLAEVLQTTFLREALYPVVARIGSRYSAVRSTAMSVAQQIAEAVGYHTLRELIEENIDYLAHQIVIRLRKISEEDVLDAVRVVTFMCPKQALKHFQVIVAQILASSNVDFRSPLIGQYLRVFRAFVDCAAATVITAPSKPVIEDNNKMDEEMGADDDDMEVENNEGNEEKEKPKPPPHVDICVKTVARCLHYLPICTNMEKVLCLEVLNTGLQVVGHWEDELLPIVHQVWGALVRRLDSTPIIIARSFTLLLTMCQLSKDFIRLRTLKEVLPSLRNYLSTSAKSSLKKTFKSGYFSTQGYKLQCQLLSGLGGLVVDLQLRERDTSSLIEAAIPYLNHQQPPQLQELAVGLFRTLSLYDPYYITYRLGCLKEKDKGTASNVDRVLNDSPT